MIGDIFRSLIFCLDQIIYGFIPTVYNFIMVLARVQVFDQGTLKTFADNIYAILGLFMIFRIAFSIIIYIVNPDQLLDEKKGFGKIISRAVIAVALIVLIPYGFNLATRLQSAVIENGLITKVILGNTNDMIGEGSKLSSYTLQAFLSCHYCSSDGNDADALKNAIEDPRDLSAMADIINERDPDTNDYVYNYTYLLSTITGGFILFMLIMFSFDIALRTVKLGFLQLISPVGVVSFVDPKSSEDGFFSRWLKVSLSTYINLFIRIAAIAFLVFIVHQLPQIADNITSHPADYGITVVGDNTTNQDQVSNTIDTPIKVVPLIYYNNSDNLVNDNKPLTNTFNNNSIDVKQMASKNSFVLATEEEVKTLSTFILIFIIIGTLMFVKEAPKVLANLFGISEENLGMKNPLSRMFGGAALGAVGGFAAGAGLKLGAGLTSGTMSALKSGVTGRNPLKGFGSGFMAGQKKVPMKGKLGAKVGGALLSPGVGLGTKRPDLSPLTAMNRQTARGERVEKRPEGSRFPKGFTSLLGNRTAAKNNLIRSNNELMAKELAYKANANSAAHKAAYEEALGKQKSAQSTYDAYDGQLKQVLEAHKDRSYVKDYKAYNLHKDFELPPETPIVGAGTPAPTPEPTLEPVQRTITTEDRGIIGNQTQNESILTDLDNSTVTPSGITVVNESSGTSNSGAVLTDEERRALRDLSRRN